VLQGYNAIVINAASPDALNGAVKEACDAGVTVVSFDGIVTEPCAWRIAVDFKQLGKDEVLYLKDKMPGGGNLLEIRGLAGVFVDDEISKGIHEGVAENPQFKIVGSVHGDWDQAKAQAAVAGILPSLPEIAAVVTQGGDGYGAAQAFADAGRPTPLIIMGSREDELKWWKEQKDANGYETMSISFAPGVSTLAFWVAQMILDGKDVPKDLVMPFLRIDQANLEANLANTDKGGVANLEYSLVDAEKMVAAAHPKSEASSIGLLENYSDKMICSYATQPASRNTRRFDARYPAEIEEAHRRGLTEEDCAQIVGYRIADVAPAQTKTLALNEICEQSLNTDKTDWSTAALSTYARKQAEALGVTVDMCRLKLGLAKVQETAKVVPDVTDPPSTGNADIAASPTIFHKKVALVIGNSNYEHSPSLANPRNDAVAITNTLIGLGFEVINGIDLSNADTVVKAREFAKAARTADLSLLFYAGHGLQIAGDNYIVPVDAKVEDETAISFELINVATITNFMGGLDTVGIILLDACRDNPFSRSLKRSMAASRAASVDQGLAPISAEGGGLFVAFATAPGDVAADGDGITNSPFTTALLKHLPTKGLEINTVMTRVKAEVAKMTKNDQRPWTNSDLTTEVYLTGAPAEQ